MKKFSLYTKAALCTLVTGSMMQPAVDNHSRPLLSRFEQSKGEALDEANPAKEETSNRWGAVVENLELALKEVKQSMEAHARIHDFAKVGAEAEKYLHTSGKPKAALAALRQVTASNENKADDKLKRAEHLASTLQKHTESTVKTVKEGLSEDSKKLTETQQKLAQADAEKSGEEKQKISKENLNKSAKKEKKHETISHAVKG